MFFGQRVERSATRPWCARSRSSAHRSALQQHSLVGTELSGARDCAKERPVPDEGPDIAHSRGSLGRPSTWNGIVFQVSGSLKSWNHNNFGNPLRSDLPQPGLPPDIAAAPLALRLRRVCGADLGLLPRSSSTHQASPPPRSRPQADGQAPEVSWFQSVTESPAHSMPSACGPSAQPREPSGCPSTWTAILRQVSAREKSRSHNELADPLRSHPPGPRLLRAPRSLLPHRGPGMSAEPWQSGCPIHPRSSGVHPSSRPSPSRDSATLNSIVSVSYGIPCA